MNEEEIRRLHASQTREDRQKIADETPYQWETCVGCGASEKDYFIETGFSMLVWHPKEGVMCCENCIGDYPDDEE